MSFWDFIVNASYFVAAVLFIYGLKQMGSPRTAKKGIKLAGIGMLVAVVFTFFHPVIEGGFWHYLLMLIAIGIGGGAAYKTGKTVQMTAMPQMVALYNGMGGGAAAAIALVEMYSHAAFEHGFALIIMAVIGALIGGVSFSGSLIAWAKLEGKLDKSFRVPGQQIINGALAVLIVILGWSIVGSDDGAPVLVTLFFLASLVFGVLLTIPIGGADMPVVISMLNSYSGWAACSIGFTLANSLLIITGALVGSSGAILSYVMCKGMNRSFFNVILGGFGGEGDVTAARVGDKAVRAGSAEDAAFIMRNASKVIVVPGYGMAVAQAQHALRELADALKEQDVEVAYAIHPVAGRMPGHMNVLLAEANVSYDKLFDLDQINDEFDRTDVAMVVGANDVVNPAARNVPDSPIYGMPILNVDRAKNIIFIKRSLSPGFAGIDNPLFYDPKTRMLFDDARRALTDLVNAVKNL